MPKNPMMIHELAQYARSKHTAQAAIDDLVQDLRMQGESWSAISEALGTSRQAAQQRYGDPNQARVKEDPNQHAVWGESTLDYAESLDPRTDQ